MDAGLLAVVCITVASGIALSIPVIRVWRQCTSERHHTPTRRYRR